ncbi:LPXTG-site transpeptidase (sortase) family protein [Natranaerovirga pectinivora]|uniref:LPXTG-site transpeptidase (Sortase) family protein n=1 Tax=Natranaerovirga pectinivora TaxID=682400 RepID=A0A4R3MI09_9FIRM|nr:class D sortase [Natranaerovirga pectinivora]TCT12877.1 LPXTG-site transpeptidase (sortase) family protein [Natranaerovirga pectinivora]
MYTPKLPVTGVTFIALGISPFYRFSLSILLIIMLLLVSFRFTRLLIKEGRLNKIYIGLLVLLSSVLLVVSFGNYEATEKSNQSNEILNTYKEALFTTTYNGLKDSIPLHSLTNEDVVVEEEREPEYHQYIPESGETIGLIAIDKIDLELPVIEDANEDNIWLGAAHILGTPHFWEKGNSFLAAHNVRTYGKLFNRLHELSLGDEIVIYTTEYIYTYSVYAIDIVPPDDTECFNQLVGEFNLSLVTCTSSGEERLIIYSERISKVAINEVI